MKQAMLKAALLGLTVLMAAPFFSQAQQQHTHSHDEKQQHAHDHDHDHSSDANSEMGAGLGAHVHGHGLLTLVLEGNEMQLAFQAAAYSVVGFEHKPSTAEQQQEIDAAIAIFNQGDWFSVNADANCELAMAEASTDLTQANSSAGHGDFYANYQLLCQRPARLNQLQLSIFNLLPALEQVEVQWIINGRQGATKTSLQNSTVQF
ncbi:ZrgA family zinc uptake protein [Rheinheimera fenheensis]|uniref:ZrgA family zinc uptake protein n=1 Tax=Rheinheimera fenheensis TaxID=3152295 RepID=UPI0032615F75